MKKRQRVGNESAITAWLSDELAKKIRHYAIEKNESISTIVTIAINRFFEQEQANYEVKK